MADCRSNLERLPVSALDPPRSPTTARPSLAGLGIPIPRVWGRVQCEEIADFEIVVLH